MSTNLGYSRVVVFDQSGQPQTKWVPSEWFGYQAAVVNLAPAETATDIVQFEAGSEFVLERLVMSADIDGAAQTFDTQVIPNVLVQINDQGNGKNLFSEPVAISSICGTGTLPSILPFNRRFAPNSAVSFTFTSFEKVVTYANLRILLSGYKSYTR